MTTPPFSEFEKNDLVSKYQNIVYYYANRYRFFDPDIEEIQGWGFLGLAKAIKRYDEDRDLDIEVYVFTMIRSEILRWKSRTRGGGPKSEQSLQTSVSGESESTLGEFIESKSDTFFEVNNIKEVIKESLFGQDDRFVQINLDHLLTQNSDDEIAIKHKVTEQFVKRTCRRGKTLIKKHFVDNGILLDHVSTRNATPQKERKTFKQKRLSKNELKKVKFIRRSYPFLEINDIAPLLNVDTHTILQLYDYPTSTYLRCTPDESIKDEVEVYCKKHYPERLPSEVKVYQSAEVVG